MSETVNFEVGQILQGRVSRIKPFGALVSLPNGAQGLVHISHISPGFVQNITDYLDVGDIVNVKVLSVDRENEKISLSIKEVEQPDADANLEAVQRIEFRTRKTIDANSTFEEKFKDWVRSSNERHAGLNKRNKRR